MTQDSRERPTMGDSSGQHERKSSDLGDGIGGGTCNATKNVYNPQEFRSAF